MNVSSGTPCGTVSVADTAPSTKGSSTGTEEKSESAEDPLLGRHEIVSFALLWGFSLTQQSLDKWISFFFLATAIGCDFMDTYGYWYFLSTILAFPWNFVSGFMTDYLESRQVLVMRSFSFVQLALAALVYMFALMAGGVMSSSTGILWMSLSFQLRQAAITQSLSSVWKLVKIRLDAVQEKRLVEWTKKRNAAKLAAKFGSSLKAPLGITEEPPSAFVRVTQEENEIVSCIGNSGDLFSNVMSVIVLGGAYIAIKQKILSFDTLTMCLAVALLCFNGGVLLLAFVLRRSDFQCKKWQQALSSPPLATAPALQQVRCVDDTTPLLSPAAASPGAQARSSRWHRGWQSVQKFAVDRWEYMKGAPVVMHLLVHSLLTLLVYTTVEYPIMLRESDNDVDDSDVQTTSNYCAGHFKDLMLQGTILCIVFLIGTLLYRSFMLKLRPRTFFGWFLLAAVLVNMLCLGLLLVNVTGILLFALISLAQVLPYYLNSFDYYCFTTGMVDEYYGFITSIYGFFCLVIYAAAGYVLAIDLSIEIVLFACFVLLFLTAAYGFCIRRYFKTDTWASQIVQLRR